MNPKAEMTNEMRGGRHFLMLVNLVSAVRLAILNHSNYPLALLWSERLSGGAERLLWRGAV